MFALIIDLKQNFDISSNHESSLGRYDIMLKPKHKNNDMAIILEFKHAKATDNLDELAKQALKQIDQLHYEAELKKHSFIKKILKIKLAFSNKSVKLAYMLDNLPKI